MLYIAREMRDRYKEAVALVNLGTMADRLGTLSDARATYEASLAISRQLGLGKVAAFALNGLGYIAFRSGDPTEGRRLLEEAIAIRRGAGLVHDLEESLFLLALCLALAQNRDATRAAIEEARRTGDDASGQKRAMLDALCAYIGDLDPEAVTLDTRVGNHAEAMACVLLHEAGQRGDHLARVRAFLEADMATLGPDERAAVWENEPTCSLLLRAERRAADAETATRPHRGGGS